MKLGGSEGIKLKKIPEKWEDFARLCRIRSGNRIIHFDPYPYQILLSDCIDRNYGTIVVKPRQHGLTEALACKFLHKAALNPAYVAVVLSKTFTDASNVAKRIRQMAESIDEYVRLETQNLTDLKLVNGGRILFRASSPNSTRGLESVSDLLFDEAAFVDNIDLIYTSAVPSTEMLGKEARIIVLSTPNGKSGFYYDLLMSGNGDRDPMAICAQMRSGQIEPLQHWVDENGWGKFILHWKAHPKHSQNPNYLEDVRRDKRLSESKVSQEYDLGFEDSETNVFLYEVVARAAVGQFEDPQPKAQYFMGLDTSTVGNDYTVLTVGKWEAGVLSIVGLYRNRKSSMDTHLAKIGGFLTKYKPKGIGIEITGGTGQIYLEQLSKAFPAFKFQAIRTTGDSKPAMIDRLNLALESNALIFPPSAIFEELAAFRRSGKKLEASNGNHDDCVMSLAFCLDVSPFKRVKVGFTNTKLGEV